MIVELSLSLKFRAAVLEGAGELVWSSVQLLVRVQVVQRGEPPPAKGTLHSPLIVLLGLEFIKLVKKFILTAKSFLPWWLSLWRFSLYSEKKDQLQPSASHFWKTSNNG